ncbi:minor virion protein [Clavavirus yamagawaense]|uniref:Minor virion protein n=1 Tax=Aeropyrum pernix bacilliform virus 1 (isolate -/Japan/Tanaka/2005) TaxID=1289471 RepID=D4QF74_APBV1|nr:minor virion protein [Aeropyrum pernix bacilliform virus 1]BAJ06118.1 minor virion protein [Aeropyrum pernix bacilliform virus 1]
MRLVPISLRRIQASGQGEGSVLREFRTLLIGVALLFLAPTLISVITGLADITLAVDVDGDGTTEDLSALLKIMALIGPVLLVAGALDAVINRG